MSRKIIVFGATSAIAVEILKLYAKNGDSLYLIARNENNLETISKDLQVRGASSVKTLSFDLSNCSKHKELFNKIDSEFPESDISLLAYGILGDQEKEEKNFKSLYENLNTNFISYTSLLTKIAERYEGRNAGNIAVISSVAGDRGRKSNYIYGSAKGGLSIFCQGLRNRLFDKGVHLLTIKPGFVSTPMTSHLEQGLLFAKPEYVAKKIVLAIDKTKDVIYVPCFWLIIMTIIKLIPEKIFKRLSI